MVENAEVKSLGGGGVTAAMTSRILLLILFVFAQAAFAALKAPNIVFILSDDLGIDGFGCYGSDRFKDKTPNIDALAASGLRFDYCYSMPTCNPSRCALMTGRYEFRTGNAPSYKEETSMARVLKQAGYTTGMAGKWRQMRDEPTDWGFDEYLTDPTPSGYYWETNYTQNGAPLEAKEGTYGPDLCRDFAIGFFERHKEKPFFFYYPTHLVHNPILKTPQSAAPSEDQDTLFADNVAYLDRQVGELVAALEKLGLRKNTIIVFSSDNGTAKYGIEHATIRGRHIHGMKETMLEGGSRVPLIVNWKGTVQAGGSSDDLIDFTDMLPTFADVAGATPPASPVLDGRSFAPQIRGDKGSPREWIYVQHNTAHEWYVRSRGWKLTQAGDLFDMSDAPFAEKAVPPGEQKAERERLQAVLAQLNPAAGKLVAQRTPEEIEEARKKNKRKRNKEKAEAAKKKQAAEGTPPAK
ncbi:MAG TPA: sulfatase-like hydrolase/transferase [Prosthecobacter sp.]